MSGLEEGARAIFPGAHLKKIYGTPSHAAAEAEFERFRAAWSAYPGAVDVWVRNWSHVAQLFNYGSVVRKVMYTTNAIESINSSFRKVMKAWEIALSRDYSVKIITPRKLKKNDFLRGRDAFSSFVSALRQQIECFFINAAIK